jgi:hypothetical protein
MFSQAKKIKTELLADGFHNFWLSVYEENPIYCKSLHASMKLLTTCESPYSNPL